MDGDSAAGAVEDAQPGCFLSRRASLLQFSVAGQARLDGISGSHKSVGLNMRASLEGAGQIGDGGKGQGDEQGEAEDLKGVKGEVFCPEEAGIGNGKDAA